MFNIKQYQHKRILFCCFVLLFCAVIEFVFHSSVYTRTDRVKNGLTKNQNDQKFT